MGCNNTQLLARIGADGAGFCAIVHGWNGSRVLCGRVLVWAVMLA